MRPQHIVSCCLLGWLAVCGSPASAQSERTESDTGYIAMCNFAVSGSQRVAPVILQFNSLIDEQLSEGDFRIFDRDELLNGLIPQAIVGDDTRIMWVFTKTVTLPVEDPRQIVNLVMNRSDDNPRLYLATLSSVGADEGDPDYFLGRCSVGQPLVSATLLFDQWKQRILASEPQP